MSADDESFHPLGKEWENDLETMLDDTEYDTDLGMKMAEDAMRVTKGELSEAEFHEKYHEDVMEEFDVDDRPTAEAYENAQEEAKGTISSMMEKFEGDGEEPRREVMKKMGAGGAAAVGLGAWGAVEDGSQQSISKAEESSSSGGGHGGEKAGTQWGMTIDLEQCDGCLSCVVACSEENKLDQGVNWMYVLDYEEEAHASAKENKTSPHPDTSRNRLVRPCQHCTDAPCEKVCPTTARHTRDEDGLVLTDYDVCIGCRYCMVACPYGVNYFQWDEPDVPYDKMDHALTEYENGEERWVDGRAPRGVMSKCTMCPDRQDGHRGESKVGTSACEDACPPNAIQFGNVHNPDSDPSQYADNPSKSRTVIETDASAPSPTALKQQLQGVEKNLDAVVKKTDLDLETIALLKAVQIVSDNPKPSKKENNSIADKERALLEVTSVLENHINLETQERLTRLRLAEIPEEGEQFQGVSKSLAQDRIEDFAGTPKSNFKLLEDMGTNPNVVYLGNEPGPNAEQVPGPVSYEDVGLTDNRKKKVLDEGTVGDVDGVSL